jgi:DNA-directed RNA polymerase specialized sigma24 family protein
MTSYSTNNHETHDNSIPRWKTDLIQIRARRLGFQTHELEEIQQDLLPNVVDFRFDPSKANGGTERTALTRVIDNLLIKIVRSRGRYQKMVNTVAEQAQHDEACREDLAEAPGITAWDRQHDVADCLQRLDDEDRLVCEALAEGEAVSQIARRLGLSWSAMEAVIARIRQRFTAMGLDAWMRSA